jgi:hypothetical protein
MPNNQNPVFTDNAAVFGDGTEEHPLTTAGGSSAPGGSTGDIQVNNNGAFGNANSVEAGAIAKVVPGTGIEIESPAGLVTYITGNGASGTVMVGVGGGVEITGVTSITITSNTGAIVLTSAAAPNPLYSIANLPIFADNAAALAGGLVAGNLYRTGADPDTICVVH